MKHSTNNWIVVLIAVAAVAVAAWWYQRTSTGPAIEPTATTEPAATQPERNGPLHPLPKMPRDDAPRELVELPALDDSDGYFALALVDLLGGGIENLLVESGLIEKVVTTIDNLPRTHVAERIRPLRRLPTDFRVERIDDDTFAIHPENAERYRFLGDMLASANGEEIYASYQRFYPLLQQAYVNLGYPDGYFNDRLIEVIDHLLATPEPVEPARLVRPHVLYQYADPNLEALSSGQKLLLRMGPENAARIKQVLEDLRARIT